MNSNTPTFHRRLLPRLCMGMILLSLCISGCSSMPLLSRKQSLEEKIENDPNYSISGVQGPTERKLRNARFQKDRERLERNTDSDMSAALAEYERGQQFMDAEDYVSAEKTFKRLVKARRDTYESVSAKWDRWWGVTPSEAYDPYSNFGDPIEEDSLYMLGEAHFAQFHYVNAQNSFDELLNRYPSTRHLDRVTRRLFKIARHWLDFPEDVGNSGDASIQLASNEQGEPIVPQKQEQKKQYALVPNLTDSSKPTFDTYGRGLQALRSIWLHDATGPLADDALMLGANHHLRTENFTEAARMYKLLREQYPDSPHFKDAFMLGSHVTLASYQGAAYDGHALHEARELKETMLQLFPDLTPEQRSRLEKEVVGLNDAEVGRLWGQVTFYQAKRVPESIALYCHLIINRYPDSRYAVEARRVLQEEQAKAREQSNRSWTNFGLARRTPQSVQQPKQIDKSLSLEAEDKPSMFGRFGNMLRRAEQPPKLKSTDETSDISEAPGSATLN